MTASSGSCALESCGAKAGQEHDTLGLDRQAHVGVSISRVNSKRILVDAQDHAAAFGSLDEGRNEVADFDLATGNFKECGHGIKEGKRFRLR